MKEYEKLATNGELLKEEIKKEDISFRVVLGIFVVTVVARASFVFSERGNYHTFDTSASVATIWDVIVASVFLIIFMRSFSVRSTLNALKATEFDGRDKNA